MKDIPGYEGLYQITEIGEVWSTKRQGSPGQWLKVFYDKKTSRYAHVNLFKDGTYTTRSVHRLVYETFVGPIPDGLEVDHVDHDPSNNHYRNLQLLTHVENVRKMWRGPNRPDRKGELNGRAKLTADVVRDMRRLYSDGLTITDLTKVFDLTKDRIWNIVHRKQWKHV